ncbi:hypothetical protein ACP4OV_005455 [Aristida adscensionis]
MMTPPSSLPRPPASPLVSTINYISILALLLWRVQTKNTLKQITPLLTKLVHAYR